MPPYALWSLVVALVILSLGLSFKLSQALFSFDLAKEEINRLVQELALIKNHQEETVSDLTKLDHTELNKVFEKYRDQINHLNQIVLNMKTPTNYTAYLKKGAKMTLGLAKAIANGDVVLKKDT